MDDDWDIIMTLEPEKGRIFIISSWADVSVFMLCHWPVQHGSAYTLAVSNLSKLFYKKISKRDIMRYFVLALKEAGIPYSVKPHFINSEIHSFAGKDLGLPVK